MTEVGYTQRLKDYKWFSQPDGTLIAVNNAFMFTFGANSTAKKGHFNTNMDGWDRSYLEGTSFTHLGWQFKCENGCWWRNRTRNSNEFFELGSRVECLQDSYANVADDRFWFLGKDGILSGLHPYSDFIANSEEWRLVRPIGDAPKFVVWQTNQVIYAAELDSAANIRTLEFPELSAVTNEPGQSPQNAKRETSRKLIALALLLVVGYGCFKLFGKIRRNRG